MFIYLFIHSVKISFILYNTHTSEVHFRQVFFFKTINIEILEHYVKCTYYNVCRSRFI